MTLLEESDPQEAASAPLITADHVVEIVAPASLPGGYGLEVSTSGTNGEEFYSTVVVVSTNLCDGLTDWLPLLKRINDGISFACVPSMLVISWSFSAGLCVCVCVWWPWCLVFILFFWFRFFSPTLLLCSSGPFDALYTTHSFCFQPPQFTKTTRIHTYIHTIIHNSHQVVS